MNLGDFSCLGLGSVVHFTFKVKLYDEVTEEGVSCEPSSTTVDCPMITFRHEFSSEEMDNWDYVRDPLMTWDPNGWNEFHGTYVVTRDWASLTSTTGSMWYIALSGGPPGNVLVVDDISMTVGHT